MRAYAAGGTYVAAAGDTAEPTEQEPLAVLANLNPSPNLKSNPHPNLNPIPNPNLNPDPNPNQEPLVIRAPSSRRRRLVHLTLNPSLDPDPNPNPSPDPIFLTLTRSL